MTSALLSFLLAATAASPFADGATVELRYSGSLTPTGRDATGASVKTFTMYGLFTSDVAGTHEVVFLVDERGGGGWSWPERYGFLSLDAKNRPTNETRIRILHDHDGSKYPLDLSQPLFEHSEKIAEDAKWIAGKFQFEVTRSRKVAGRDCWQIDVSNSFGRRKQIWVKKGSNLVVASSQRITMGRGDQFNLKMELESLKELDSSARSKVTKPLRLLRQLQESLGRGKDEIRPELTKTQVATALKIVKQLEQEAAGTPFSKLASVISRDVKAQSRRDDDLANLSQKFVGQPVPQFTLKTLRNKTVNSKEFAGHVVVLHFWSYKDKPLVEPYGQVGYLEYLKANAERKKYNVRIFGVAVNSRLADAGQYSSGVRSARKLKSFMNLSYPVMTDNGEVLNKFGDPRRLGAKLPLWIVIGADGKIADYKVGLYSIKPDKGLHELQSVVAEQVKKQRTK